jgi:hypothetical protein
VGLYYQPPQPPQLPPSIVPEKYPVILNNPPFGKMRSGQPADVFDTWIPPDPQPFQKILSIVPAKYPIIISAPPIVGNLDPDYFGEILIGWIPPDPQPLQKGPAVSQLLFGKWGSQPPPIGNAIDPDYMANILETWVSPDPPPMPRPGIAPAIPLLILVQPAFTGFSRLANILETWIPPDPQPAQKGNSNPQLLFGSWGMNPPFGSPRIPGAIPLWTPPDPQPLLLPRIAPLILIVQQRPAYNQLMLLRSILEGWNQADPAPIRGFLNILPGWSVDNPPPSTAAILRRVVDLWIPSDPIIQSRQQIAPFLIFAPYLPPNQALALNAVMSWWNRGDPDMPPPRIDTATLTAILPIIRRIISTSWTTRQPGASFTTRVPGASITTSKPGADFEEE